MVDRHTLRALVQEHLAKGMPPNVALAHLLAQAESEVEVTAVLSACGPQALPLIELWQGREEAFQRVKAIHQVGWGRDWTAVFDQAAAIDPHAAVALYSLGDPDLLGAATKELVTALREWNALGNRVLDFGCGTGRVTAAVAPMVEQVTAMDMSGRMVELAREAAADFENVTVHQGGDLTAFADGVFDTILAIDSMPYVVESGAAERFWPEAARCLQPGGVLAIMNYSYRGDLVRDQEEVARQAERFGFAVERGGTRDLSLWDGVAFVLRKMR